jgi:hypothetical protein
MNRNPLDYAAVMVSDKEPGPDGEVNDYFDVEPLLDSGEKGEREARKFIANMIREARANGSNPRRLRGVESDTFPRVYEVGGGASGYYRFWIEGGRFNA